MGEECVKDYVASVTAHVVAPEAENARGLKFKRQLSSLKYLMRALRLCVSSCSHRLSLKIATS